MLKNVFRNNILKNRIFMSSSSFEKYVPFGFTPKNYMLGLGISFVSVTGYTYYNSVGREFNRYRPNPNFIECSKLGLFISSIWPIAIAPFTFLVLLGEIAFYTNKLDYEYEKKQKMIENSKKNE